MNLLKRLLSGVTAVAMTLTICGDISTKAEEPTIEISQMENDVSLTANHPLGALLLVKTEENTEIDHSSGVYGISEIEVENGTASV